MFEYLVLSGAGPYGLGQLGIIKTMIDSQKLDLKKIKKMYGTSAGACICSLLSLDIDINQIIEYFIHRPWNKVVKLDMENVFCLLNDKKGLIDHELLKHVLFPLFNANDIPIDITLKEVYDKTKIELHLMTSELSSFTTVTLNHLTFPELKLVDACCMSASIPPIFTPVQYKDKYYIDGGLLNTYPLDNLISSIPSTEHDKILSVRVLQKENDVSFKEMTSIAYVQYILNKSFEVLGHYNVKFQLKHEVICWTEHSSTGFEVWKLFMGTVENRQSIYQEGVTSCKLFLDDRLLN